MTRGQHMRADNIGAAIDRIASEADVRWRLTALLELDPRLRPFAQKCGDVPLRILGQGYSGLVQIIVGQLLSVAAARAIHSRLVTHVAEVTPKNIILANEDDLRNLGLSRAKIKSLKNIAHALDSGEFDMLALDRLEGDEALRQLMELPGVGRWTAELYLISGMGHPDYFPAGDLALRKMVQLVIDDEQLPSEAEVRKIAHSWSPHRAVAARLLWRYFAFVRDKEGVPL